MTTKQKSMWNSVKGERSSMDMKSDGAKQKGQAEAAQCEDHSGSRKLVELSRGITVAGARGGSINYSEADLVVDCAGLTKSAFNNASSSVLSGTKWLVDALSQTVRHPDTLFIDWPDMGVPRVGVEFWKALYAATPDNARVVFACMGGHGRTGTALACYMAAGMSELGSVVNAVEIIRLVRAKHCGCAIETQGQEDYIARVVAALRAPGAKAELDVQYSLIDEAKGERESCRARAKSGSKPKATSATMSVSQAKGTSIASALPPLPAKGESEVGGLIDLDEQDEQDEAVGAKLPAQIGKLLANVPDSASIYRDAAGSVVTCGGAVLLARSVMEEDGSLPSVIAANLPPTSKLPAGARKRWNVAALTGPDQTVFDVRRGDGPVEFQVVGTKQNAIDVIVALSLVDRTDRNAMRVALMANPEIASKLPDIGDQFSKSEEAKGAEFLLWLRKRGRSMLENGSRPWHGKVEGGAGAKPPTMATLLTKLAGGGTN